jgi:hypothetical protein
MENVSSVDNLLLMFCVTIFLAVHTLPIKFIKWLRELRKKNIYKIY